MRGVKLKKKMFEIIFLKVRKKIVQNLGAKNRRKNLHKHPGPPFQIRGGPGSFSNAKQLIQTYVCIKKSTSSFQKYFWFNSSLETITNMSVDANCETQNENNEVPYKRPKVEMDVK